ncbi:hypothetical protein DL767_009829 [Monosporascus sp. MG133]|nr:hypothetical protein DL767_009829 [Monosporascus sp. MG133]
MATLVARPTPESFTKGRINTETSLTPAYVQANLIVLPSRYAADFRLLCARNPVPCPLLAESSKPGRYDAFRSHVAGLSDLQIIAPDCDVRRDAPRYNAYRDAELVEWGCLGIANRWTDDHVAFLIGCSFSFESALTAAGLTPRHTVLGRNVPVYRTTVPLCPAGVFTDATYPIVFGWDALVRLGIRDIDNPEWGEATQAEDGSPLRSGVGTFDLEPGISIVRSTSDRWRSNPPGSAGRTPDDPMLVGNPKSKMGPGPLRGTSGPPSA